MKNPLRDQVIGVDERIPLLSGRSVPYVNFDNAASTPSLKRVSDKVNHFLRYYSSIHRGTGFKSRLSSHAYEESRHLAGQFMGYDPDVHTVIFGKNTTEAINKLSFRLAWPDRPVVIVSQLEHHSNDLPWRNKAEVIHAPVDPLDGTLRVNELHQLIGQHRDRLFLVSISGASNVTGTLTPIGEIAEAVHAAGAYLMADCAQLAPHRAVSMGKPEDARSIDFVAYSAHKMYAPFGTGVLVARKDLLHRGEGPEYRGGGTVKIVTLDQVEWDGEPYIDEAGSPNVIGTIALAEAIRFYQEVGFEAIEDVERSLTRRLLEALQAIPQVEVYGKKDPLDLDDRLGVVPFNVEGIPHALLAAVLAHEYGIGVRNGCFCAHPYIKILLRVTAEQEKQLIEDIQADDRSNLPGAVRVSFGFYNTDEELDRLLDALSSIIQKPERYRSAYEIQPYSGEFHPGGVTEDFSPFFRV